MGRVRHMQKTKIFPSETKFSSKCTEQKVCTVIYNRNPLKLPGNRKGEMSYPAKMRDDRKL